ncbi:nucleotidyltransferase domain-containing protein [Candidatus Woesearchaeota archaeon]|nr:nucleotidyltransferase domain-containing protein [Candidatus Woesearchaeota archaeon]
MDNKLKIINFLGKNINKSYTMHELSNILRIPYATFHRTISEINDLLIIKDVGKSKVIQINIKNPIIKAHLTVSSDEERKEYLKHQPIIKKITNEINTKEIIVLFGSYAKKTYNEKSDIDIIVINKSGKKTISFSKYEILFRKKINPIFITEKEFKDMLGSEEENVGKQALQYNIILNNPESFWECVFNGIKSV